MGFRSSKIRGGVYVVACLLLIFIASGCNSFSLKNEMSDPGGMILSSGVDKKTSAVDFSQSTNNNYDREFREATRSGNEPPPSPNAPGDTDNTSIVSTTLAASGMAETIESWFLPKAYADDHQLDERYLIREGECSLKAESYKDAAGQIEGIAKLYNGMVADSHSQKLHDESVEGWLKLRIPTENFFDAWRDVREIGEVLEESVSTQDVSQQYVGYVSRLKNLMAEQAVLTEMLDEALAVQRARGLGEGYSILLDTQERLFKVTGEIESTEDRMGALADQITRSTITVRITEIKKLPEQIKETFSWGFGETAGGAFKDLQFTLRNMVQGLIYFLITCWTWLIPWAIFIWLGRLVYKKFVAPRLQDEKKLAKAVAVPKGDFKPKN